jgi:hypothetical protein
MMKNPTFAKFMNEVDDFISSLAKDDLKKIILHLAETQDVKNRNEFLRSIKESDKQVPGQDDSKFLPDASPDQLIEQIRAYEKRIQSGEFYDEEKSAWAYDREEHSYWGRGDYYDDYDDEIDFSNEEYVLEAVTYLEAAKAFYRLKNFDTALAAYKMLFNIFENPEYYGEEYFIYGFSFDEAIDADFLKEHKTIYLRCQYLICADVQDFGEMYQMLMQEKDISFSDLIEIDRNPLPRLEAFIDGFIQFLAAHPEHDSHLVDVLFIKGGMEEVRRYAYDNGKKHPSVFLYYYEFAKEDESARTNLLNIILDGIRIIPEKYRIRSYLGLDLISLAKESNDKNNLLMGYSTAFYSAPSLRNLAYYIHFIISENVTSELDKLINYLSTKDIKRSEVLGFPNTYYDMHREIFSLETAAIGTKALVVGKFLAEPIEGLIDLINPKDYLGFSGGKNYVAMATALTLKAITKDAAALIVDKLLDYYCFDTQSDEYSLLKQLVIDRSKNISLPQPSIQKCLGTIELLSVNRVSHILGDKLRGGYDSACLLLVACAEAKQLISRDGNALISNIDTEYKRYSAFRRVLKSLSAQSRLLISVK